MFCIRKGAENMTNVLMNVENIIDTYEEEKDVDNKEVSKLETILLYLKLKKAMNEEYAQNLIEKYIVKDKTINSGRATIKGTRVTPEDIGRALNLKDNMTIEDIMEEYPSLEKEEEVMAGLMVYISSHISVMKILLAK